MIMLKNFYNLLIGVKVTQIDLFDVLAKAEHDGVIYKLTNDIFTSGGKLFYDPNESPVFISLYRPESDEPEKKTYVAYYGNLFFSFYIDEKRNDRIVRIYAKKPDEDWIMTFDKFNGQYEPQHPSNAMTEVFVAYDVDVLGLDRCVGRKYNSGAWNKMFYKTFGKFADAVDKFGIKNVIDEAYGK